MIRPAERAQTKLRISLSAPSGAGKTYSALLLASGLTDWEKIVVIDTENGRGDLYAHLGPYRILRLDPPYSPEAYINALMECEEEGFEVIIIDSMSHEWDGKGGALQLNVRIAQGKYGGNTWGAWSEMTPRHQNLLYAITGSSAHIITTVRNKTETAMIEENGKKIVKKIGIKEIQRDDYIYEFMLSFNIDRETHLATPGKDNTGLFEGGDPFVISNKTGRALKKWANSGREVAEVPLINQTQLEKLNDFIEYFDLDVPGMLEYYSIPDVRRMTKEDAGDLLMKLTKKKTKIESKKK